MSKSFVVVTGGSGFIASHIIAQLLEAGYAVRTTVRNIEQKSPLIEQMLHQAGVTDLSDLSLVAADLTNPDHWDDAINGADYVIHPASPTPTLNFKDEREMIARWSHLPSTEYCMSCRPLPSITSNAWC